MKNLHSLFLILLFGLGVGACYDDKSSYDTQALPVVSIGDDENQTISKRVPYLGNLKIDIPVKKDGQENHPDLSYKWVVEASTSPRILEVLSNERVLDVSATLPISASGYFLTLEVTDSATTLKYYALFKLIVESEFGEGVIVAGTCDGVTSDISLIMDTPVTKEFSGDKPVIFYDIYKIQGEPIQDIIRNVTYTVSGATWGSYDNILWMAGDKGLYRVICKDYSIQGTKQVIPFVDDPISSAVFYPSVQTTILTVNNQVYSHGRQNDAVFIAPEKISNNEGVQSNYVDNNIIAAAVGDNSHASGSAVWYDANIECFGRYNGMYSAPKFALYSASEHHVSKPFDASNVPNKEAIAGGYMNTENLVMVLRDKTTKEYSIYTFFTKDYNSYSLEPMALYTVPGNLKSILDVAVSITFSSIDPIFYVATETEIYAVTLNIDATVTVSSKYTVASGEKIALIKFYNQGRYNMNPEDFRYDDDGLITLPLNTKAVLVGTQSSEFEGHVYLVPQKDPGTGNLDKDKQFKYSGFSKILDITTQGR